MPEITSKEKILDASIRLFTENGYKKTTTKLIAKEAGVNEVTIFRQFGSKEGIVLEIVRSRLQYLRPIKDFFQARAVFDLEKDLVEAGSLYYNVISNNIEMLMVLSHEMGPAFQQAFSIIPLELKATLSDYFVKMQNTNKVIDIDPELLAVSFASSNMGFAVMNKLFNKDFIKFSVQEFIKNNIRIFAKGITP